MLQKISIILNLIFLGIIGWLLISKDTVNDKREEELIMKSTEEQTKVDSFYILRKEVKENKLLEFKEIDRMSPDSATSLLMKNLWNYEKSINDTLSSHVFPTGISPNK